jgi:predicted TIM-barrel fold metal-dependent hydrolase
VPVPIVVDHMGRMHHSHGVHDPGFQALRRGVAEGRYMAKVSGTYRLGATRPDYLEAKPFHDALVAANPDALVWGTDWPHPRPDGGRPDAARLLEVFLDWTPDPALRRKILTETPARLYDFPPA